MRFALAGHLGRERGIVVVMGTAVAADIAVEIEAEYIHSVSVYIHSYLQVGVYWQQRSVVVVVLLLRLLSVERNNACNNHYNALQLPNHNRDSYN